MCLKEDDRFIILLLSPWIGAIGGCVIFFVAMYVYKYFTQ